MLFFFFNSENFSLVFLSAFFPQCHTELLCGQWDFCLFCTWRYAVARNTACMKYLKAGRFLPSPFRIILLFFGRKKKNPELPNKLNILILKLNCSFFFFFKNALRKAAAANSRCWHLSWPWVFFTWKPAAHCSSGAQRMHSPLRVGVWCWGPLGWAQVFGVSFPNLIARRGMLVPLSFPPWV